MIDGWPIAHHVFEGNQRDCSTVESVVKDIEERFGLRRVVFVGDRGMVTSQNIDLLRSARPGVRGGAQPQKASRGAGLPRASHRAVAGVPAGIAASEKAVPKDFSSGSGLRETRGASVCGPQR